MTQTHQDSPVAVKPVKRPMELGVRMGWYILKNRLRGRKRFPLVTMLEPLEMCNLACIGCGRIREYRGVLDQMMPVGQALAAVRDAGAPIVSIAGGEPTIHPQIDEIINTLVAEKYFVYCCTNALLLPRMLDKIPPSKYFCWVVHIDGMEEKHDESVARAGVFRRAVDGITMAVARGYRVCTNTTVFRNSDVEDLRAMFRYVSSLGVEGSMLSPGYDFEDAPDQDLVPDPAGIPPRVPQPARPGPNGRDAFLQQPPVPELSARGTGIPVHRLVQPHLHGVGLAPALLPAGRRAYPRCGRSVRTPPVGGTVRRGPRPALQQLHDALRVRVGHDFQRHRQAPGVGDFHQVRRGPQRRHQRRLTRQRRP